MKKLAMYLAVALLGIFAVTGCQKADHGSSSGGGTSTNAPASTNQ